MFKYMIEALNVGLVPLRARPYTKEGDFLMTIQAWLNTESLDFLLYLYKNKQANNLTKGYVKEAIMRKLELKDDDSFELWLKLQ